MNNQQTKIKRETKILNLSLSYDFKTKLDMKKFLYKYNCKDIIKKIIDINDNEKKNYSFYNKK